MTQIIEIPDEIELTSPIEVPISRLIAINSRINKLTLEKNASDLAAKTAKDLVKTLEQTVLNLRKELEAALKPPPVVVPPPVPPAPPVQPRVDVWPEEPAFSIDGLIMATIENSMGEPSPTQYTAVKRSGDALAALDVKAVRFWLGPLEVAGHIDPKAKLAYLGNLVDYMRQKHIHYIAEAMDRALAIQNDDQLKVYVKGLNDLHAWAVCWNDADKEPVAKLKADVERIRNAGWKGPIIFSLRGTAKIADYAEIKNIIFEFQTFGSDDEYDQYVATGADFLCLDLRVPQTKEDIARIFSVALADDIKRTKPRGYTLYTSKTRDWAGTPQDEVDEIRDFVKKVEAQKIA